MRGLLLLLALAACTPDFAAPSDVFDLRVLAVQAEPPEALYDPDAGTVQDVRVRALVADPRAPDGQALSAEASLCAPTDSQRCPSPPFLAVDDGRQPHAMNDGGIELSYRVDIGPFVAAAKAADKLQGLGGVRVMLALSVDDGDPHGPVHAAKTLLYSPIGTTPNRNPSMTGVSLTKSAQDAGTLLPDGTLELTPGVQIGLRPLLAPDAEEEYDTTDLRGNRVHLKEHAVYSFFTTPGAELDRDNADEPLDGGAPPDGLVRIDLVRGGGAGSACGVQFCGTMWIVVRDGRGGQSWLSFPWKSAP